MTAYYNENDAYCAGWLRNLIAEGLIADGYVDDRSILDVRPSDLEGFTQCHFFAGLGGWSGALRLADWPDHRAVWTGSCPCQPFSLAGRQGGFADERHLWPYWFHHIQIRRPPIVLGEQVASAGEWLRLVRGDLEALEYAVGVMPLEAASAGADHLRDRYWFVGDLDREGQLQQEWLELAERGWLGDASSSILAADDTGSQGRRLLPERVDQRVARADGVANPFGSPVRDEPGRRDGASGAGAGLHSDDREGTLPDAKSEQAWTSGQPRECERLEWVIGADGKARRVKSGIRLLAHGIPNRVAKLRAFGNAIDLRPAAAFIQAVM